MKRLLSLVFLMILLAASVSAQGVDQDEFSGILDKVVNFQSYQGAHQKIDSLAAILNIGTELSKGVNRAKDSSGSYGAGYRVLHILGGPDEKGKPADIVIFTEQSGVDHIDNVRRIVSAYLTGAYQYSKKDADLLAFYITVYNAVYRGNLEYFSKRYKASVLKELSAAKVGLALSYKEWPGKTQMLIPLGIGVGTVSDKNQLSSVSAAELVGPQVLETVKDTPDRNTEKRKDMANLMDRAVDQEQTAIDAEKERLAKEKAEILKKQQLEAAQASPAPTVSPDRTAAQASPSPAAAAADLGTSPAPSPEASASQAAESTAAPADSAKTSESAAPKTEDQKKLDDIAKQEADLAKRQEQNKELSDATKALRDDTAKDLGKAASDAAASENLVFLYSRLDNGYIVSKIQRINTASGEVLADGKDYEILNRQVQEFSGAYLVLAREGENATLALVDQASLGIAKKGSSVISPYSQVVVLSGGKECLAVVQTEGAWYLGRFDASLSPLARSMIPVDPLGVIEVKGTVILVQRQDGRATTLNINDLRTAR